MYWVKLEILMSFIMHIFIIHCIMFASLKGTIYLSARRHNILLKPKAKLDAVMLIALRIPLLPWPWSN